MTTSQQGLLDMAGHGGMDVTTMNTSVHDEGVVTTPFQKYVSDEAFTYIVISIMTVANGIVATLGVTTNILNIIVFLKQGVFSDSSTVSLFGLAVADLISVASALWTGIMFCVALLEPQGLNWSPWEIMYMTAAWPHVIAGLITRLITALISFERCFCVVFPFKVRNVFTPRSSSVMVLIIFAYFILSYTPVYILNTFHFVTDPETNSTRFVMIVGSGWAVAQLVLSYANLYTINFMSVIIVIICTTITISRVKLSSAWRDSMGTGNQGKYNNKNTKEILHKFEKVVISKFENKNRFVNVKESAQIEEDHSQKKLSSSKMQKEKKLIRMITLISVLFLLGYMPSISLPIALAFDKEMRTDGLYKNLTFVLFVVSWFTETLNSSINIFIYYKMSSKFRITFNLLFGISEE